MCVCILSCFSHVRLFVTLWTIGYQVPLSIGFSREEYWSGLPCPSPGDLLNPGINPVSFMSPALGELFATSATGEALISLPMPVKEGVWGKTKWKENQNETR